MTRAESGTRSITNIRVDSSRGLASLTWWPRLGAAAIDPERPAASIELPLVASVAGAAEGQPG
jgi:hypothetical protein